MDFVHEQQRATPLLTPDARLFKGLLEIGHAREDGRHLLEGESCCTGKQPGNRGLARAGRSPQDDGADAAGVEHARKRTLRADEMSLADDLRKRRRTEAVSEGAWRLARQACSLEEVRHSTSPGNLEAQHPAIAIDGK